MAGENRTATHALEVARALGEAPYRFDFYRAIRLLECVYARNPRVGQSLRPADDPIRLTQEPSLAFAPSAVAGFASRDGGRPPRLSVFFFGLFGPNGPLPLHLTEHARDRQRNSGDPTFIRFVDLFHHRLLSLFYRAWASAQPVVNFDRPATDRFALYVGSLFGLGTPALRNRDALPDLAKLHFAGQLSCQTRHADGLRACLTGFLSLPVAIEEFIGQWLELPVESACRLGGPVESSTLGAAVALGTRTWDCQTKFRVVIGPLKMADYESLLPGGETLPRLVALVHGYAGDEMTWDVHLVLKQEDVPSLELDGRGRLGWTTWLTSRPLDRDADELSLNPSAEAA